MSNDDVLYLVIHRQLIEEDRDSDDMHPDQKREAKRVLDRIEQLDSKHPDDIKYFEGKIPDFANLTDLTKDYSTIVLCGCCRAVCLDYASQVLMKAGKSVAYDIRGTY